MAITKCEFIKLLLKKTIVEHKEKIHKHQVLIYPHSYKWCYSFWENGSKNGRKETIEVDISY
jgi:hypothetical protein